MKRMMTVFATVLSVLPLQVVPAGGQEKLTNYFPPPESKGGWRTLLPEKGNPDASRKKEIRDVAGVDWDRLAQAWEHNIRAEGPTMMVVIRRGYVVGEWYNDEWMEKWGRNKAPGFYSTTKAYISTAFGLLLDDSDKGKLPGGRTLTLETKVCNKEWMPEALPLSDPRRADITLRHLLFATSGIPREGLKIPEEVRKRAKGPFEMALGHVEGSPWAKLTGAPGTMFNYSSPGVLHLILLFNNAAKVDLLPYIKERVCDPIGMENVGWGKTGGKDSSVLTARRAHSTARDAITRVSSIWQCTGASGPARDCARRLLRLGVPGHEAKPRLRRPVVARSALQGCARRLRSDLRPSLQ
jgi:CubicO group peptidase (beta-lactamase class C family)